jgi:hypothetical protein
MGDGMWSCLVSAVCGLWFGSWLPRFGYADLLGISTWVLIFYICHYFFCGLGAWGHQLGEVVCRYFLRVQVVRGLEGLMESLVRICSLYHPQS